MCVCLFGYVCVMCSLTWTGPLTGMYVCVFGCVCVMCSLDLDRAIGRCVCLRVFAYMFVRVCFMCMYMCAYTLCVSCVMCKGGKVGCLTSPARLGTHWGSPSFKLRLENHSIKPARIKQKLFLYIMNDSVETRWKKGGG